LESLALRVSSGSFEPPHIPNENDELRAQGRASSGQILKRKDRKDLEIHEFKDVPVRNAKGWSTGETYHEIREVMPPGWKAYPQQLLVVSTFEIWNRASESFSKDTAFKAMFFARKVELQRHGAFNMDTEKQVHDNTTVYSSPYFPTHPAHFSA